MSENRSGWRSASGSFSFQSGSVGENGNSPSSPNNKHRAIANAAHLKEVSNLTQINSTLRSQIRELQRKQQSKGQPVSNVAKQHLRSAVSSNSVLGKPFLTKLENSSGECNILSDRNNPSCSRGVISQIYKRCSAALQLLQEPITPPTKEGTITSKEHVDLLVSVLSEILSTGGSLSGLYAALLLLICDRNGRLADDMKRVIPPAVHIFSTAVSLQPPGEAINCIESVVFPTGMHVDFSAFDSDEELPHADDEELMSMAAKGAAKTKSATSSSVYENGRLRPHHHRFLLENYCTSSLQSVIVGGGSQQDQHSLGIDCWSSLSTLVTPNTNNHTANSDPLMHVSSKEAMLLCQRMCSTVGGVGPVLLRQIDYSPEAISGLTTTLIDAGLPKCNPVLISVVLASVGFVRQAEKHVPNNRLLQLLMSTIRGFSALPPPSNHRAAAAIEGLFPHIRCEHTYRQIYKLALSDAGAALKLIQDIGVRSENGISATARSITAHKPGNATCEWIVNPKSLRTALEIAFFIGAVLKEPAYKTYRTAMFTKGEEEDEEPASLSSKRARSGGDSPVRRRPKMDESEPAETTDKQEGQDMQEQFSYMCFFRVAEQASDLVIIMEKVLTKPKELSPLQECFTHAVIVLDSLLSYCPDIAVYSHLLFAPICIVDDFIKNHSQLLTTPLSPTRLRVFNESARRMTLLKENLRIR